jgi:hypothetical protein
MMTRSKREAKFEGRFFISDIKTESCKFDHCSQQTAARREANWIAIDTRDSIRRFSDM